jgi:hypothetical protein
MVYLEIIVLLFVALFCAIIAFSALKGLFLIRAGQGIEGKLVSPILLIVFSYCTFQLCSLILHRYELYVSPTVLNGKLIEVYKNNEGDYTAVFEYSYNNKTDSLEQVFSKDAAQKLIGAKSKVYTIHLSKTFNTAVVADLKE